MPITPLPTPPSRQDNEATFVSRANAFLDALPAFGTEANALATEVNTNTQTTLTAKDIAVAAANYRGEYAAGTTYQIGQSVSYLDEFFFAKTINTGVTPVQGANWQRYPRLLSYYQEFTASGTWTRPAGVTWVYVEVIGGGGGGARNSSAAGGGGGGGFNSRLFQASDTGATETVTVGAGGVGRATNTGNADGGNGGTSSIGSLITALGGRGAVTSLGGSGGGYETGNGYAAGGGATPSGSVGTTGGLSFKGGAGGGSVASISAGSGGTSTEGGNGGAAANGGASNAGNGVAPGGGGGGKRYTIDATDGASGAGAAGRVRVWAW